MPMPYEYDDEAKYQQALVEWNKKKESGDPFPGPMPQRSAQLSAAQAVKDSGFNPNIQNYGFYQQIAQAGARAPERDNPYSATIADQSRPAQMALLAQMQQQMQGPSLAGMQGQRAMAQGGQMVLRNAAMGAPARAGMVGAAQAGAGMAGDVGQARLAEVMRAQAGRGGLAGGLRAGDLRSAEQQMRAGLQARGQGDEMSRFYAAQGAGLAQSQDRAFLELFKLQQRKALEDKERQMKALNNAMGGLASGAAGFLK